MGLSRLKRNVISFWRKQRLTKIGLFPARFYVSLTVNCRMVMGFFFFLLLNQYQIKPRQVELSRQQLAYSPSKRSERELVTDIFKLNLKESGLL